MDKRKIVSVVLCTLLLFLVNIQIVVGQSENIYPQTEDYCWAVGSAGNYVIGYTFQLKHWEAHILDGDDEWATYGYLISPRYFDGLGQDIVEFVLVENSPIDTSLDLLAYGRVQGEQKCQWIKQVGFEWVTLRIEISPDMSNQYYYCWDDGISDWELVNEFHFTGKASNHPYIKLGTEWQFSNGSVYAPNARSGGRSLEVCTLAEGWQPFSSMNWFGYGCQDNLNESCATCVWGDSSYEFITVVWSFWIYDENGDKVIQKSEAIHAVCDYFDGRITKEQVLEVLDVYFT